MRFQETFIVFVLVWLLAMLLWHNAAPAKKDRSAQDVAATKVEPNGSYMVTDPDTGHTLLLPGKYLPQGYRPPPSTGPCDAAAKATIDNWRRNITLVVAALGAVVVVFGLFMLAESTFSKS